MLGFGSMADRIWETLMNSSTDTEVIVAEKERVGQEAGRQETPATVQSSTDLVNLYRAWCEATDAKGVALWAFSDWIWDVTSENLPEGYRLTDLLTETEIDLLLASLSSDLATAQGIVSGIDSGP